MPVLCICSTFQMHVKIMNAIKMCEIHGIIGTLPCKSGLFFFLCTNFFFCSLFLGFFEQKSTKFVSYFYYLLITNNKKHKPKVLRTTFLCLLVFLLFKNVPLEWFSLFFSLFELSPNFWTLITWDLLSLWRFGRFLSLEGLPLIKCWLDSLISF